MGNANLLFVLLADDDGIAGSYLSDLEPFQCDAVLAHSRHVVELAGALPRPYVDCIGEAERAPLVLHRARIGDILHPTILLQYESLAVVQYQRFDGERITHSTDDVVSVRSHLLGKIARHVIGLVHFIFPVSKGDGPTEILATTEHIAAIFQLEIVTDVDGLKAGAVVKHLVSLHASLKVHFL